VAQVTAADRSLAPGQVAAAVDAAAGNDQALRSLAAALAGRTARDVLADGAPPGVGRLVTELIARGSAEFTAPACKSCGTTGRPLTRSSRGGVCPRCRNRLLAVACGCCGGGQAGCRPHRCRRAGLRAVPPSRARAPALRDVRQDRSDRGPGPRRARRHMRELLPDAAGPLHRLRPPAAVQLRRRRQPGLQDVHPAGRERLRPLRPGPAGGRAVARGPGLRHLLHQRAAPPRRLHGLRSAAAADRAARPGRDHVRGLRRPTAHPRMRAMRRRGQTVRERPLRTLQPARPGLGPAGRRRDRSDPRAHRGRRGHHGGPESLLGPELAADQRSRGNPRRDRSRPHRTDSPGTGRSPEPAGRRLPAAHADRRRSAARPGRGPGPRRTMEP